MLRPPPQRQPPAPSRVNRKPQGLRKQRVPHAHAPVPQAQPLSVSPHVLGDVEPTALVPATSITRAEVAFLFHELENYNDAKLQSSLHAIRQKIGQTIDVQQFEKFARLASQGMLSRTEVLHLSAALAHQGGLEAPVVLVADKAFRALVSRIRVLYLALALHRKRLQMSNNTGEQSSAKHRQSANAAPSARRQSAVDELRHALNRSQVAQKYFADAITAQAARVSATYAVKSSELASQVAVQIGLDKLVSVAQMTEQRRLRHALGTWRQVSQMQLLVDETQRWLRVRAAHELMTTLHTWQLQTLRRTMMHLQMQARAHREIEEFAAAIEIQRCCRGWIVRLHASHFERNVAATRIQAVIRGFVARHIARVVRQQHATEKALQVARCQVRQQNVTNAPRDKVDLPAVDGQLTDDNRIEESGVQIEVPVPEYLLPNAGVSPTMPRAQTETHAAMAIQSNVRGWIARVRISRLRTKRYAQLQLASVLHIQAFVRGSLARRRYHKFRRQAQGAAMCIQRGYRNYREYQHQQLSDVQTKHSLRIAATTIQRAWGCYRRCQRQQPSQLLVPSSTTHEQHVITLQRAARRYLATKRRSMGVTGRSHSPVHELPKAQNETVALPVNGVPFDTSALRDHHTRHVRQIVVLQSAARMFLTRLHLDQHAPRAVHPRPQERTKSLPIAPGRDLLIPAEGLDSNEQDEESQTPRHHHKIQQPQQEHAGLAIQATRIQATWRSWCGRRTAHERLTMHQQTLRAAATIGRAVLQHHQRRRRRVAQLVNLWCGVGVSYIVIRRQLKHRRISVVRQILRLWRLNAAKDLQIQQLKNRAELNKKKLEASIQIQRMVRGSQARILVQSQRDMLLTLRHERIAKRTHRTAVLLQCFVRCVFAKRLLRHKHEAAAEARRLLEEQRRMKRTIDELYVQHTRSMYALRIQRLYRGFRGREIYAQLVEEAEEQGRDRAHKHQLRAAQGIQTLWRGYLARKLARKLRQQQLLRRRRRARRKKRSN